MKQLLIVVVILVLLLALYMTNPSEAEFYKYIEESTERNVKESQGTGIDALDNTMANLAGEYSKQSIKDHTTKKDFLILSIFTIKTSDKHYIYLGVVDNFFYINEKSVE